MPPTEAPPEATPALRELRGVVERITYQNASNGYTVARLAPERANQEARAGTDDDRLITLVGTLADLQPGEAIVAHGWWRNDPKHGWQFQAQDYRTTLPATLQGMKKYLGSGLVKGIGPVMAGRIVDAFGETTSQVIDEDPSRLTQIAGIGPVRAARLATTWAEQRHIREVMAALQDFGVSTSLAVRIYKRFGDESGRVVGQEPYRLARQVWGIGFKTADKIARAVGIAVGAPERLEAGLLHALGAAADEGHTLLPEDSLIEQAAELLGVDQEALAAALERLLATGELVAGTRADSVGQLVALAPFARAESNLAGRLKGLAQSVEWARVGRVFGHVDWSAAFGWLASKHQLRLAPEQEAGVRMALTAPVSILTGGPGTGKMHTLRAVLALASAKRLRCVLAAPTGRAAKRMEEATGVPATTLHRLLELRPGANRAQKTLQADLVVVDEVSMLDALLGNQLARALLPGTHLLLVGDPDQLPSVGAGDVLADLLRSGQFPVTTLSHIFRQGVGSGIAMNAASLYALTHAYAATVHKVQGSEFPAVVILLLMTHAPMLGRTLLYTALTRARHLVIIVGHKRALALAVTDWRRAPRHTALDGLLAGTLEYTWVRSPSQHEAASEEGDVWEALTANAPESFAGS
jgi:exodeoxyribonuclease V alpha subunit